MTKAKTESQSEKFKRLAREVEADDDESAFDDKLKRLAKQKPAERNDENGQADS